MGEVRAGFLGTLKSELDDSDDDYALDAAFEQLLMMHSAARAAYLEYRLRPDKAASLFRMLRLNASDGHEWTVGPTSGMWYRRSPGTSEWSRASMPVGLSPVYDAEPDWLRDGIASYLVTNGSDPAEVREESRAASGEPTSFEQGLFNPFAELKEGARTTSGKAMEFGVGGEEVDWLLEEWSEFDESLNQLREMRKKGTGGGRPTLPGNLPADWDADRNLVEAATGDSQPPTRREDSSPDDPSWEPQALEGYVNPESFFLPPEEQ